jgi:hypothetical protein
VRVQGLGFRDLGFLNPGIRTFGTTKPLGSISMSSMLALAISLFLSSTALATFSSLALFFCEEVRNEMPSSSLPEGAEALPPTFGRACRGFQGLDFGTCRPLFPLLSSILPPSLAGGRRRSEGGRCLGMGGLRIDLMLDIRRNSAPHPLEGHAKGSGFWILGPVVPPQNLVVGGARLGCLVAKVATHPGGGRG